MLCEGCARTVESANPIPIDRGRVEDIADDLIDDIRQWMEREVTMADIEEFPFHPLPEKTKLAETSFEIKSVTGKTRNVDLDLFTGDYSIDDYGPDGFMGEVSPVQRGFDHVLARIYVPHDMTLNTLEHYRRDFVATLIHEITHAKDFIGEKFEQGYYEDPAEQRAFTNQIIDEVWFGMKDWLDFEHAEFKFDSVRDLIRQQLDRNDHWGAIKRKLTKNERRKMLTRIYKGIQDRLEDYKQNNKVPF
jgi:hypothetical protein